MSIIIKSITPSTSTARRSRSGRSKGRSYLARTTSRATARTLVRDVLPRRSNAARAEYSGSREWKNARGSTLDVRTIYRSRGSSTSPTSIDIISRRSSTEAIGQLGLPTRTGCRSPVLGSSTTAIDTTNFYRPMNRPREDSLASDLGGHSRRSTRAYSLRASALIRPIYPT